ncbi:thioredoxin family protein [Cellulomonas sp. KRMCY2]|uniref:thioredoxin family protein n=1 Tax=Cellulomonas sp. KRMCY2 TaxID=1304865 RepID=UPI00045E9CA2|nr:thioredoxin family protein [Cellulomonas sp. KRMCY2]
MTNSALQLVALLALSSLVWWLTQRRRGQFRPSGPTSTTLTGAGSSVLGTGHALGARATFVQFSAETCSTCPQVRRVLTEVASSAPDVGFLELAADDHMDLVRRLGILRTPTVLLLGRDGEIHSRTSGPITPAQATAALHDLPSSRTHAHAPVPTFASAPTPWSSHV